MAKKVKLKLPKSIMDFDPQDREEVIAVLREALELPKVKVLPRSTGDEHNMWERNGDGLLGEAEDDFYQELADPWAETMADLFIALGLDLEGVDTEKAFSNDFREWEALVKAKGHGRSKMSDLIKANKKKRTQFLKWVQDGKAFTKAQLNKIDKLLREDLPNYAKKAEELAVRAGFIGKIRNQAERENFETLGAYIDRFPKTIEASRKEGVVLTTKHADKEKRKGKTVKVLPLTEQEQEAVVHATHHAGDKLTEISGRHRAGVRQLVMTAKKERWNAQKLAQELFDKFGEHNRDWRRVAITELSFATNDAYLSGLEENERVIGMGSVKACKYCKQYVINKEFTVTHKVPKKDTYHTDMKQVWAGKTNYGRRVAEYRACIPMHPNCRCRWHRISRFYKAGDDGTVKRKTTAELIQEERAKRGLPPDPNIEAKLKEIRGE